MADETPYPALSLATTGELLAELGGRYPDYVFAGRRAWVGDADADAGRFTVSLIGQTDAVVGLSERLRVVAAMRMRAELEQALETEEPDDGG